MKKIVLVLIISFVSGTYMQLTAQKGFQFPDSVKYRKNVIRWNLAPFLLWSNRNINIGYERVLKPYRSFSINAGYFELPSLTQGIFDSLNIQRSGKKWGFTVSGDYRFYFDKRNKRMAPDGLYWGAYGSFHHYQFQNDIVILNSPEIQGVLNFGANLNILSGGVELGYQFIIKERLSIDLVFLGPSISVYTTKMTLGGDIDVDKENEYLQAIYDILSGTIPGFDELVDKGTVTASGTNFSFGLGFRYLIQIGYRF
ncbi:MAG: DUF3575 domain-containing protein [Chlorobi bacterium]|nr:DUF3575 domain-containing protein [Chlorobiota bacterium]